VSLKLKKDIFKKKILKLNELFPRYELYAFLEEEATLGYVLQDAMDEGRRERTLSILELTTEELR
jgi:hypothetical protein